MLYGRGWDDEHGDTAYDLACKSSVTLLASWPWYGLLSEIARSDPDIVEDSDGRVFIFEAHEGALRCNDAAFVELGGCGVAVHLVPPALLAGLRQQNVARTVTQAALQLEQAHVPQAGQWTTKNLSFADPSKASSGATVEVMVNASGATPGVALLDCRSRASGASHLKPSRLSSHVRSVQRDAHS